jgi:hypothetical protein
MSHSGQGRAWERGGHHISCTRESCRSCCGAETFRLVPIAVVLVVEAVGELLRHIKAAEPSDRRPNNVRRELPTLDTSQCHVLHPVVGALVKDQAGALAGREDVFV